jgi:hypothetical protein
MLPRPVRQFVQLQNTATNHKNVPPTISTGWKEKIQNVVLLHCALIANTDNEIATLGVHYLT